MPVANFRNSALLTSDENDTATHYYTCSLLCSPPEPMHDLNIYERPPTKLEVLAQMGYIINMAYLHVIIFETH
jgi:hypothetical protein